MQFVRVLYCKLLTNIKQPPGVPLEAVLRTETTLPPWHLAWEKDNTIWMICSIHLKCGTAHSAMLHIKVSMCHYVHLLN